MCNTKITRWALLPGCCALLLAVGACAGTQASQAPAPGVSRADRDWLVAAHQADMAEMQAGQLAQDKGGVQAIRAAGTALYHDHQVFDRELVSAAQALKVPLPTHMTVHQTEIGDRLVSETGFQFDHDFTASMMSAHQRVIALTRSEIAHGSASRIVALARQALPVLSKHLRMLKAAASAG